MAMLLKDRKRTEGRKINKRISFDHKSFFFKNFLILNISAVNRSTQGVDRWRWTNSEVKRQRKRCGGTKEERKKDR